MRKRRLTGNDVEMQSSMRKQTLKENNAGMKTQCRGLDLCEPLSRELHIDLDFREPLLHGMSPDFDFREPLSRDL